VGSARASVELVKVSTAPAGPHGCSQSERDVTRGSCPEWVVGVLQRCAQSTDHKMHDGRRGMSVGSDDLEW
jgi:hypothetical protein